MNKEKPFYEIRVNGERVGLWAHWTLERVKQYEEQMNSLIPSIYKSIDDYDKNNTVDELIARWGWESKSLQQSPRSIKLKERYNL